MSQPVCTLTLSLSSSDASSLTSGGFQLYVYCGFMTSRPVLPLVMGVLPIYPNNSISLYDFSVCQAYCAPTAQNIYAPPVIANHCDTGTGQTVTISAGAAMTPQAQSTYPSAVYISNSGTATFVTGLSQTLDNVNFVPVSSYATLVGTSYGLAPNGLYAIAFSQQNNSPGSYMPTPQGPATAFSATYGQTIAISYSSTSGFTSSSPTLLPIGSMTNFTSVLITQPPSNAPLAMSPTQVPYD